MNDRRPWSVEDSPARVVRGAFDSEHYLKEREDLRRASVDPVAHYINVGWKEGLNPHPDFDVRFYLDANPDVAASGSEPFYHFLRFGREEGRRPNERGEKFGNRVKRVPPTVSVLLPAYRPNYLDLAISSILAQTFTDFELIIGDDSIGDTLASIISKWQDPRITYRNNPNRQVPASNGRFLLTEANGKYVRFAHDDDFMLPTSLERLVEAADREKAAVVYQARYDVDEMGIVTEARIAVPLGGETRMDARRFFTNVVGASRNFIGEPNNILISRDAMNTVKDPFAIEGRPMQFLGDVALYANMVDRGFEIVGLSYFGGAFRHHQAQFSNSDGPSYSAGLFEWEYLLRWGADRGHLGDDTYLPAIARIVHEMYRAWVHRFPELQRFIDLAGRGEGGKYLTAAYLEALEEARAAVNARTKSDF